MEGGVRNRRRKLRDDGLIPEVIPKEKKFSLPEMPDWTGNGGPNWNYLNRSQNWIEAGTYPKARALSPYPGNPIR